MINIKKLKLDIKRLIFSFVHMNFIDTYKQCCYDAMKQFLLHGMRTVEESYQKHYMRFMCSARSSATLSFSWIYFALFIFIISANFVIPRDAISTLSVPRSIGGEERIKVINYVQNRVIKFVGHYTYHTIIQFESDESVQTITMGTQSGWQIQPQGNRIFLKPIDENAITNMTIITNKRIYFFEMHARHANGIDDPQLIFMLRFIYPDSDGNGSLSGAALSQNIAAPDLSSPQNYNFNYKVSGPGKNIEPILVFDDNEFTYFRFRGLNAEIPAIFAVDSNRNEMLVNYRIFAGYVVVERVHNKFTLRSGHDTICVYNESFNTETFGNIKNDMKERLDLPR